MPTLIRSSLAAFVLVLLAGRLEAVNRLFIAPQTTAVGATGVVVPVRLDNDQQLYAYSLSLSTSLSDLQIVGLNLDGTSVTGAGWSFGQILDGGARVNWGVVLDITEPFDTQNVIPVGQNLHVANLVVDVKSTGPDTANLNFQDVPGQGSVPAAKNLLVGDQGTSIAPATQAGVITIEAEVTGAQFRRGDADNNRNLELTDAIRILGYLFLGVDAPPCLESADADDSGGVELTDAVRVLNFLFTGGPPPAAPGPPPGACGPDPVGSVDIGCDRYDC